MIQVLTVKNFFGYSFHGKEGHNNVEDTSSGYYAAEDEPVKVNLPSLWHTSNYRHVRGDHIITFNGYVRTSDERMIIVGDGEGEMNEDLLNLCSYILKCLLDKISSIRARPNYSTNNRVNGNRSHLLDEI